MDSATAPVGGSITPVPAGPHHIVCVDGINLGMRVEDYDKKQRLVAKYALVFQSSKVNPETGERFLIVKEVTLSMSEKGNLRKLVEGWIGAKFTDEQAEKFDLANLYGRNGIGTIIQQEKQSGGGSYAKLTAITGLMDGMPTIQPLNYKRPEYLIERKAEYAEEAAKFAAKEGVSSGMIPSGIPSHAAPSVPASGALAASVTPQPQTGMAPKMTVAQAGAIMVSGTPLGQRSIEELQQLYNWAMGKNNQHMLTAADLLLTAKRAELQEQPDFSDFPGALKDEDDDLPF